MLRGERSTWRLLQLLYHDYGPRQLPPPDFPAPPEDWGAHMSAMGPLSPHLVSANIERRVNHQQAGGGASREPAEAGLAVRSLHDEEAEEKRMQCAIGLSPAPLLSRPDPLQRHPAPSAASLPHCYLRPPKN